MRFLFNILIVFLGMHLQTHAAKKINSNPCQAAFTDVLDGSLPQHASKNLPQSLSEMAARNQLDKPKDDVFSLSRKTAYGRRAAKLALLNHIELYLKLKSQHVSSESFAQSEKIRNEIVNFINQNPFLKNKNVRFQPEDWPQSSLWNKETVSGSFHLDSKSLEVIDQPKRTTLIEDAKIYAPQGLSLLHLATLLGDQALLYSLLTEAKVDPRTLKTRQDGSIENNILHITLKKGLFDSYKMILKNMPVQYFGSKKQRFVDEKDPHKQTPQLMAFLIYFKSGKRDVLDLLSRHQPSGEVEFYYQGHRYDALEFLTQMDRVELIMYTKVGRNYHLNKDNKNQKGRRTQPPSSQAAHF